MEVKNIMLELAKKVKKASSQLAALSPKDKNRILQKIAEKLEANRELIQSENAKDMKNGKEKGLSSALLDRLLLNDKRIDGMIESLHAVVNLPDPVGEEFDQKKLANGLTIAKKRMPLGVIGMIFESRPNVTVEAASLTLKSGNGIVLRGGSEAIHSNTALGRLIGDAIEESGYDRNMVGVVQTTDREAVGVMLKAEGLIDVIIPRGGEGLIKFVSENSTLPVIKHDKGVCSLFVNADASREMAESIAVNAKVQRPGVCNSIENLYLHKDYPFKREILETLAGEGVKVKVYGELGEVYPEGEKVMNINEFNVEYLDLIISGKIVDSVEEAVEMINTYGSGHSDSIVSENYFDILKFLNNVGSAAVYANASTRFTDGFEFGLGAEIGISTNKLHARGPVGLQELTTYKYVILGEGQIRE
jgi:glutamate-5-semialdehyde dehydrogenase